MVPAADKLEILHVELVDLAEALSAALPDFRAAPFFCLFLSGLHCPGCWFIALSTSSHWHVV